VRVILTDKGAIFTPALKKLKPDTDSTYEIKVINRTSKPSSFRVGYRATKTLKKGASQFFYFSFHLIGDVKWSAKSGRKTTGKGVFHVHLQKSLLGAGGGGEGG
jgi:hypothetical protein